MTAPICFGCHVNSATIGLQLDVNILISFYYL